MTQIQRRISDFPEEFSFWKSFFFIFHTTLLKSWIAQCYSRKWSLIRRGQNVCQDKHISFLPVNLSRHGEPPPQLGKSVSCSTGFVAYARNIITQPFMVSSCRMGLNRMSIKGGAAGEGGMRGTSNCENNVVNERKRQLRCTDCVS